VEITLYQIDAFATKPFEGNPAAVCLLNEWLPDEVMQSIAEENQRGNTGNRSTKLIKETKEFPND